MSPYKNIFISIIPLYSGRDIFETQRLFYYECTITAHNVIHVKSIKTNIIKITVDCVGCEKKMWKTDGLKIPDIFAIRAWAWLCCTMPPHCIVLTPKMQETKMCQKCPIGLNCVHCCRCRHRTRIQIHQHTAISIYFSNRQCQVKQGLKQLCLNLAGAQRPFPVFFFVFFTMKWAKQYSYIFTYHYQHHHTTLQNAASYETNPSLACCAYAKYNIMHPLSIVILNCFSFADT